MSDTENSTHGEVAVPNLLVVDDSAMMRTMVKRVIAMTEARVGTVYEAANGEEALAILRQFPVHILFTDVNMPIMTGPELLRNLANDDAFKHLIRVVISTDGSSSRRHELEALGVSTYLEKPFSPEAIRDLLTNLE